MFDFNKYDDLVSMRKYEGFIDRDGSFYKVCPRSKRMEGDYHNEWASAFIKEKLNINDIKFGKTVSSLFTLVTLNSPANILVDCFGFVYYSHEPIYFKPIVRIPNPKIANCRVTDEQLDSLFTIMYANKENTNLALFDPSSGIYDNQEEDKDYSYRL